MEEYNSIGKYYITKHERIEMRIEMTMYRLGKLPRLKRPAQNIHFGCTEDVNW